MIKYLLRRLLHGVFSIVIVVGIVMVLIYTLLNRDAIFANDSVISHLTGNSKAIYEYSKWEEYGYLEFVQFSDYTSDLLKDEKITEEEFYQINDLGLVASEDSELTKKYAKEFEKYYSERGFEVKRLKGKKKGNMIDGDNRPQLIAVKDLPLFQRLGSYFGSIITIDTIHYVQEDIENRGITFTWSDPLNGGFSPAIMGNGTKHKYLLYFDNQFPFIHQNLITINLGKSNVVYSGQDLSDVMNSSSLQGASILSEKKTITGETMTTSMDLHTAMYSSGRLSASDMKNFGDQYFTCLETTNGMSKVGYSFVIGIISAFLAYFLGVPLGILMALKKDKLADKLGTIYIVFIMAVPSLAYIFLFRQVGSWFGLPGTFRSGLGAAYYVLPIISLALPSVAGLMKWIRRYMIDQMNSDYVKFARSGGLSEGQIFTKHILKNAAIPIVHGIPGVILTSVIGGIITESVYAVPGTGKLLTTAINKHDNGVIVGLTFFYACLSVVSLILGDILMSLVDPRISFTSKGR